MGIVIPMGFSNGHFRFRLSSDPEEMTTAIGFQSNEAVTGDIEAIDFLQAIEDSGLIDAAVMCSEYTFQGVRVERMTPGGVIPTEFDAPVTGTMSGGCLPNNCAHLVDKVTNLGGRKGRGRMYFPPLYVPETAIDHQGNMALGSVADLTNVFQTFRIAMETALMPLRLFHSPGGPIPTPITGLRMQQQIATQRERMR